MNSAFAEESVKTRPKQEIQNLMSGEEFHAAGLHRLSPEELEVLNTWLYGYVELERREAVEEAIPSGEPSFGLEQVTQRVASIFQRDTPDEIESRIAGTFRGWRGNTVFKLENGQTWQQSGDGEFFVRLEDPVVRIRRGTFGSYLLSVEGYGSTVRVRRVD
ncbi:MAG: hypothetical protein JJU00_10525 [Opitutales bacterium]|nr:hypothetical protein [Opitutales bacterium]